MAMPSLHRRALLGALASVPAVAFGETSPGAGQMSVIAMKSRALGETRRLTIYQPPNWRSGDRYPVLYLADGQFAGPFISDIARMVVAGSVRPLVIAGLWSAEAGPQSRGEEYVKGHPDGLYRYRKFERYFTQEVLPAIEAAYGASGAREDRMVAGWSDGGAWALGMGLGHPELFGHVAALSVSSASAAGSIDSPRRPPLFLASGDDEPYFRDLTRELAKEARKSPVEVIYRTAPGKHEPAVWLPMLHEAVLWAFGTQKKGSDGL